MTVALIYKRDDRRKEPRRAQGKGGSQGPPHFARGAYAKEQFAYLKEIKSQNCHPVRRGI
jgi:hypothetical protein